MFYLWTPFTDQDELPIFDSGRPDFDFTQLFARNRFSGTDRIADANHVAFALTTRRLDADTGIARISASIGQLYRLQAPRVQLPGQAQSGAGATDFLAVVDYRMTDRFGFKVDTQWSPTINQFTRTSTAIDYRRDRSYAYAAYHMRNGLLEQTDVLISTPVYRGLGMLARWRYSLPDQRSLDSLVGLSYETCCWGVNASYRRYISNTAGDDNTGVYIQLELKGLARIGTGVQNLLLPNQVE
jgi:LPS-assembly protein